MRALLLSATVLALAGAAASTSAGAAEQSVVPHETERFRVGVGEWGWRAMGYVVNPIGRVESSLFERATAPKQGVGAPDAWLVMAPEYAEGLRDLQVGHEVVLLTWFDRADRAVLATRPRDDPANPMTGVFSTRSPDRPNPIGLHRVRILDRDGLRVRVGPLEALDGTPVIDLKPVLDPEER